jgi:hypothetical protein
MPPRLSSASHGALVLDPQTRAVIVEYSRS